MDKTVRQGGTPPHSPLYGKFVLRSKKFFAHDEDNTCNIGDGWFASWKPAPEQEKALASGGNRRKSEVIVQVEKSGPSPD
jgi:hypothetical protein